MRHPRRYAGFANRCGGFANARGANRLVFDDTRAMKATRPTFKGSWFLAAVVAAILIGEVVAWEISSHFGMRNNPWVVAFLCAGLVAAIASVLYDGADIG
jgi:hypothetical protein